MWLYTAYTFRGIKTTKPFVCLAIFQDALPRNSNIHPSHFVFIYIALGAEETNKKKQYDDDDLYGKPYFTKNLAGIC